MSSVSHAPPAALAPLAPSAEQLHLDALEATLAAREAELSTLRRSLQDLQARYLDEIGPYYAEFGRLERELLDAEVRAGLRPPPADESDNPSGAGSSGESSASASCGARPGASGDLKRMFRDLAKAIHPDLADDEPARFHRHSLMAEANRAYAERDEDRLRLIQRAWERSAGAAFSDGDGLSGAARRIAIVDRRLIDIGAELADLRASAIWRLKERIDDARAQGWDLFNEMILQVKSDIARATRRLAALRGRSGSH